MATVNIGSVGLRRAGAEFQCFEPPVYDAACPEDSAEDNEHSPGGGDPADQPTKYSRKDKSLGLLCDKFLRLYQNCFNQTISLDHAAVRLNVERRRIYDIVNVLESVEVVKRKQKNCYAWCGTEKLQETLAKMRDQALSSTSGEDASESQSSQSSGPKLSERKEKSLGLLSHKFIQMFLQSESQVVSMEEAAQRLLGSSEDQAQVKTKIRRLYDIANILSSLRLIEKTHVADSRKPAFRWLNSKSIAQPSNRMLPSAAEPVCGAKHRLDAFEATSPKRLKVAHVHSTPSCEKTFSSSAGQLAVSDSCDHKWRVQDGTVLHNVHATTTQAHIPPSSPTKLHAPLSHGLAPLMRAATLQMPLLTAFASNDLLRAGSMPMELMHPLAAASTTGYWNLLGCWPNVPPFAAAAAAPLMVTPVVPPLARTLITNAAGQPVMPLTAAAAVTCQPEGFGFISLPSQPLHSVPSSAAAAAAAGAAQVPLPLVPLPLAQCLPAPIPTGHAALAPHYKSAFVPAMPQQAAVVASEAAPTGVAPANGQNNKEDAKAACESTKPEAVKPIHCKARRARGCLPLSLSQQLGLSSNQELQLAAPQEFGSKLTNSCFRAASGGFLGVHSLPQASLGASQCGV